MPIQAIRFLSPFITLFLLLYSVHLLSHLIPGNLIELLYGDWIEPEQKIRLNSDLAKYGLPKNFSDYLYKLFQGDWGYSISKQKDVFDLIISAFPKTLLLSSIALFFGAATGSLIGALLGQPGVNKLLKRFARAFFLFIQSMPTFARAPLFVLLLAVVWPLFPVAGHGEWKHLVLPSLTLGTGIMASCALWTQSLVIDTWKANYVRAAIAKGLPRRQVLKHVLWVNSAPMLRYWILIFADLLAGSIVVEAIFDWPGIGKLFVSAYNSRDFVLLQGLTLWVALVYGLLFSIGRHSEKRANPLLKKDALL